MAAALEVIQQFAHRNQWHRDSSRSRFGAAAGGTYAREEMAWETASGWSHWGNELAPPVVDGNEPYSGGYEL